MASSGPNSPASAADDASYGATAWTGATDVFSSNGTGAFVGLSGTGTIAEDTVKLIKGGTVSGDNKSTGATLPSVYTYVNYGTSIDLWGVTLAYSDINASDFGVAFAVIRATGNLSHYLTATNFGFSIPSGATIDGIVVGIQEARTNINPLDYALVDHVRITVYYTEGGGGSNPKSVTRGSMLTGPMRRIIG